MLLSKDLQHAPADISMCILIARPEKQNFALLSLVVGSAIQSMLSLSILEHSKLNIYILKQARG